MYSRGDILKSLILMLVGIAFLPVVANAQINGYGWLSNESLVSGGGTGASVASLLDSGCSFYSGACTDVSLNPLSPDITFAASALNFSTSLNTFGDWLASNPYVNGGSISYLNLANVNSGTNLDPSIWLFTGAGYFSNGQTFSFTHDDGITVIVNGSTWINVPGPTSPTLDTATWTGSSGNYPFEIIYAECCSPPAVLVTDIGQIPEPSTWLLMGCGFGLLALAWTLRQRA